jgi:hypothetical protein
MRSKTRSEHRQGSGALDHDPGASEGKNQEEDSLGQLPAAQDGVVKVSIEQLPVVLGDKTHKPGVSQASARIPGQPEANRGAMKEIFEQPEHRG